jgi:hypothetical protein
LHFLFTKEMIGVAPGNPDFFLLAGGTTLLLILFKKGVTA